MIKRLLILTSILLGVSCLFFLAITKGIVGMSYTYFLPILWVIIIPVVLEIWDFSKRKLLILFHLFVVLSGVYAFFLYQLYLNLKNSVSFTSDDFSTLNSMMFSSENSFYLMIYSGAVGFLIDLFLLRKYGKRFFLS